MRGGRVKGGSGGSEKKNEVIVKVQKKLGGGQVRSGMGVEGWGLVEGERIGW